MSARIWLSSAALSTFAIFTVVSAAPSAALTAKECSAKYKAAKTAGTLKGETWNEFRIKECAGTESTTESKPAQKPSSTPSANTAATSGAVFPKSVDAKYAKKSPGAARFYTCLDQYRENKKKNGNGGLRWIQKGRGYYSLCNKALKSYADQGLIRR